jgi:hypothetical protein
MASDLKASVSITADTSGLIKGVNGAMEKISRISATSSMMAGMMGAGQILGYAQQLLGIVSDRSQHLSKLAHTFSPEAMTSAANLSQAQLASDQKIGQAMGPAQAGIDRMKQEYLAEETANTLKNAEAIGEGMITLNAIWEQTKAIGVGAADASLMALGAATKVPEMVDAMAANPIQAAAGTALQPIMGAGSTGIMMAIESTLMAIFSKVKGD